MNHRRRLLSIDDGLQKSNEIWYAADEKITLHTEAGVLEHTYDAETRMGKIITGSCIRTFPTYFREYPADVMAKVFVPRYVNAIADYAFNETKGIIFENVDFFRKVASAGLNSFSGSACFTNKDIVTRCYNLHNLRAKSITVTRGFTASPQQSEKINACPDVTIQGNVVLQGSVPASFFYGSNAFYNSYKIKKLTITGTITFDGTAQASYKRLFSANNDYNLQTGTTLHFQYEGIACTAYQANADYSRISKIYVGNGSSAEHDNAILAMYLANEGWATYESKLDTEYNYLNQ